MRGSYPAVRCIMTRVDLIEPSAHAGQELGQNPDQNPDQNLVRAGGRWAIAPCGDCLPGDLVAFIPAGSRLTPWLLERLRLWDGVRGRGLLGGECGNRVLSFMDQGRTVEGILYPAQLCDAEDEIYGDPYTFHAISVDPRRYGVAGIVVRDGDDVAHWLGIEPLCESADGVSDRGTTC